MSQQNNPFAEAMKFFSNFQVPALNYKDAFNAGRKNVEALTAANQAVAEGAQAVIRRQVEIAQSNAEGALNLMKEVYASKSPEASIAKQAEFAKKVFESSLANTRELVEMASKSGAEAAEIISKQFVSGVEEISKVSKKAANA